MGVTIGSTGVGSVTLGGMPLAAIHVGTTKVWPSIASMDIDFTRAQVTSGAGYIEVINAWPSDVPDFSKITAIEIVEGPVVGMHFPISEARRTGEYSAEFYGPTLPGSVNWELVTRLHIYYEP